MSDFLFLESQLGLYKEQCECWKVAHEEAMRCRCIEDAISFGLTILKSIQRHNEVWASQIERGLVEFNWDDAKKFANWYSWWLERSKLLLAAVEESEKHGFSVEGANIFREQIIDISLLPLDIDNTKKSIESLEEGKGIPLRRAIDELRCGKG